MTQYLVREDYVPFAPEAGEQIRIQHKYNCDGGSDHKARLYIKRESTGVIKAYCHNCSKRGIYRPDDYIRPVDDILEPELNELITIPKDALFDPKLIPVPYRAHLFKYDITYEEIEANKICYSPGLKRLIFPVSDRVGGLVSWQGRSLTDKVKYIGQSIPGESYPHYAANLRPVDNEVVVLTEDFISAMRCARHLPSVAVHGVHGSEYLIATILKNHRYGIIFFDDDNNIVREKTRELCESFGLLLDGCVAITGYNKDPKEFGRDELKNVLNKVYMKFKGG